MTVTGIVVLLAACRSLFGLPGESTGLGPDRCSPRCACGDDSFVAVDYTEADLRALHAWVLSEPAAELTQDPYQRPAAQPFQPANVCAVVAESKQEKTYRLRSFDSAAAATEAGAWITHTGACGTCSSLADLAVYIRHTDLATPVRQCGLEHFLGSRESHIECLERIGFTRPCAQAWYYNTRHTRKVCLDVCLASLGSKYHRADGSPNACIQCDEDKSGEVFKAVAGRTRRNSGLPSALCRPCDTVSPVVHRYPPGEQP